MKAYKITPSGDTRFDCLYVPVTDKTWADALEQVEQSLDTQYNEKDWSDIKVTVECVELTEKEWAEIEENTKEWTS
jgi:hypothetical protein